MDQNGYHKWQFFCWLYNYKQSNIIRVELKCFGLSVERSKMFKRQFQWVMEHDWYIRQYGSKKPKKKIAEKTQKLIDFLELICLKNGAYSVEVEEPVAA